MNDQISIKKLVLIQQQHEKVKKSCRGISKELSAMNELLNIFNIHENHELMKGSREAIKDYQRLTLTLGKMQRIIKQIENEILVQGDN